MSLRVVISGAGFLADAYDLFVINVAVDLMSRCDYHQALTPDMKTTIKSMALAGAVVGQLGFGAIADLIGRRKVFIITCALVLLGALMSAVVTDTSAGIYSQLCFWRFILGVGVGGEYPLSASITSESSEDGNRAKNLATVFSMQGIGTVLCSVVLVILTNSDISYDAQWRIALGLGGLPMALAFYFRWKMHETTWREESLAYQSIEQLNSISERSNITIEESSFDRVRSYFINGFAYVRRIVWKNRISLLGTAGAWFILDIVFYANGLFSGQVTKAMGIASSLRQESFAALILQLLALPGYFCTIFYVSSIGLLRLQLIGFAITAIIFFLLAGLQPYLVKIPVLYVFLYGFTFFFQNFGANATTYIIPSIIFSSAERATCHGISSAAGKVGALLGAQTFLFLVGTFCTHDNCGKSAPTKQVDSGLRLTFFVCGMLAVIGWVWSYFFVIDTPAVSLLDNQLGTDLKEVKVEDDEDDEDEENSGRLYEMADLQLSHPVTEETRLDTENSNY